MRYEISIIAVVNFADDETDAYFQVWERVRGRRDDHDVYLDVLDVIESISEPDAFVSEPLTLPCPTCGAPESRWRVLFGGGTACDVCDSIISS